MDGALEKGLYEEKPCPKTPTELERHGPNQTPKKVEEKVKRDGKTFRIK